MPTFHSKQTAIHVIHNWEYADAAARTGATGFVAADVGKLAKQTDTGEYWELTATTPTWEQKIIGSLNVGTPASGNALVYNGSNWVASNVSAGQADSLIESFQNETGGTLSQLEAVYISGVDIPSGLATIAKADASNVSTMPSIGIVENDITTGNSGNVIISGLLGGVDTSSFSANDILYVSATTPGQLTATRPTGAADKVQELAEVIRSHATQGIIQVFGSGSAALLSNLPQNTAWVGDANNAPTSTSVVLADGTVDSTGQQDFTAGLRSDDIDSVSAAGIAVADDMTLAQGKTINLQGASGGPQSGTARDVLAKIGHILDGGHPANPYPTSRNADDAEFNNSTQAENNTIGTHAGGDFWEWSPGAPAAANINTTVPSALYIQKNTADSGTDRALVGNMSTITTDEVYTGEIVVLPISKQSKLDNFVGIKLLDTVSSKYIIVRLEDDGTNGMQVTGAYDTGAGETTAGTLVIANKIAMAVLAVRRYESGGNAYARYYLVLEGLPASMHINNSTGFAQTNMGAKADFVPDEVHIVFGATTLDYWAIDSYRRIE